MQIATFFLLFCFVFFKTISGAPESCGPQLNNLTSPFTVTAYAPDNTKYNGLKIENWNVFQAVVASYCPFLGTSQANLCPNGTDMVLQGSLYPVCLVPGGQDTYVNVDGLMAITPQHEHSIPPGAYFESVGWTWTALPIHQPRPHHCPENNDFYDCTPPTGYWDFLAPNAAHGGVMACPNENESNVTSIYAITPDFNRIDCVPLVGLGTHPYSSIDPPVYSYI